MWSSTPASASTPPVRRTTTATAGSCSTSCGTSAVRPPDVSRLMDLGLAGRGYLLTGASRGLGFAVARALVDDGARVLVSARSADAVASAAEELGGEPNAFGTAADLGDPATAERLVGETREKLGRVDGALISVGGPAPGTVLEATEDDWRAAVDSVLLGTPRLVEALGSHLHDRAA